MKANVIICDNCHCKFDKESIVVKRKTVNIEGKGIEVAYFKCMHCGKSYLTEVVNYAVEKKKKKFDKILASLRRKQALGIKPNESRIKEAIDLKDDLISYEMKLKDKYKSLIPREVLD
nr:MAG TPA: HTH-type transcriptional regulator [Caudoviricetes sp.]